eukprot:7339306-Prymnesium_polylepis.2
MALKRRASRPGCTLYEYVERLESLVVLCNYSLHCHRRETQTKNEIENQIRAATSCTAKR